MYSVHIPHPAYNAKIKETVRQMDIFGMGLMVSWLTLLIVALNLGGDAYAWNSPIIIGLLAGTGAAFIAFIVAENFAAQPVIPMGLFVSWKYRNVPIITGNLICSSRRYSNPAYKRIQWHAHCFSSIYTQRYV